MSTSILSLLTTPSSSGLKTFFSDLRNDNLINYSFQYYLVLAIFLGFVLTSHFLHNPFYVAWIIFGILPFIDEKITHDIQNPSKEQQKALRKQLRYKAPLYVTMVFDWIILIWGIREAVYNEVGYFYSFGVIFVLSLLQASSINISHEIFHKLNFFEQTMGTLNLLKNLYMHFFIEHNFGHHKNVATELDPATSRYGETFFQFLPRTLIGGFKSAWTIENKRCKELYGRELSIYNRMIYLTTIETLAPIVVWFYFGWKIASIFVVTAFLSVMILEAINYLEHYGLLRKKLENGQYENITITHSWNAPHRISNYLLFKLQRHSDHHENSTKPYQTLCTYDESPTLPNGYSVCLLLCFFPSTWFKIMNPIVDAHKKGEKLKEETKKFIDSQVMSFIINSNIVFLGLLVVQTAINRIA